MTPFHPLAELIELATDIRMRAEMRAGDEARVRAAYRNREIVARGHEEKSSPPEKLFARVE
jgi:hypothetical protein